ncbi:hypothetical protein [Burkholderia ubonensis]|nr:hypothetical protein [Burkholderia ubonensis]
MAEPFKYLGASIPTIVLSGVAYYVATKVILIPLRKGSYQDTKSSLSKATLNSQPEAGAVVVSL